MRNAAVRYDTCRTIKANHWSNHWWREILALVSECISNIRSKIRPPHARRVRAGPALLHTPRYRVIRVSVQTFQEKSRCSPYLGALINVECAQCIYETCHVAY